MPNQQVPTDSNFSRTIVDDPESYKPAATAQPSLLVNPKRHDGEMKITDWNSRDGELSEVIDSEGHRVRINHY